MAETFDPTQITYADAQEYIGNALDPGSPTNVSFYEGDHWQDGTGWSGPLLNITHQLYRDTYQEIQRMFTSQNAIKELVNRETMAAVGDMPHLSIVLNRIVDEANPETDDEKAFLQEANVLFRNWFDDNQGHELLKRASVNAALTGVSCLRFYVPASKLEGNSVPRIDATQISDYLHLEAAPPSTSIVYEDPESRMEVGLFSYTMKIDGEDTDLMEMVWVDPDSLLTTIRIIDNNDNEVASVSDLDLMGNITIGDMKRPVLITESIRSLQKELNMTLTMMGRNVTHGGFLERIFFNAQMPGSVEVDPVTGTETFVPDGLTVGPGATTFLAGVVTKDAEGNERVSQPSAYYHDPIDTETFVTAHDGFYRSMLQEAQQAHVEMTAMARVSGESRRQARAEFANQARIPAGQVEVVLRWIVKTFYAYLDLFASGSYYEKVIPKVDITLDIGPLPAEEVAELTETYKQGLVSLQTAMARYNVKDVQTEITKIAEQPYQAAELQAKRAETFLYLTKGGVVPELAARIAGYSSQMSVLIGQSTIETSGEDVDDIVDNDQKPEGVSAQVGNPETLTRKDDPAVAKPNPLKGV